VLVAAAVLPHPPLLVTGVAGGAAPELDELRAAVRDAVARVSATKPQRTFVIGSDAGVRAMTLAPWAPGCAEAALAIDVPEPLPLPLLVGAGLTAGTVRSFVVVDPQLDAGECAAIGADLATAADRVGMVVMGDGSARHTTKAPGYVDDRAGPYDEAVHRALASADLDALLALDPALADALLVAGRPPWQVLAGAAGGSRWQVGPVSFTAPYGVGYHVASWTRA
jgi:hypothetical protein